MTHRIRTLDFHRNELAERRERNRRNEDRRNETGLTDAIECGLSQWAEGATVSRIRKAIAALELGLETFGEEVPATKVWALMENGKRVDAKIIETQYGTAWLVKDEDAQARFGRKFIPTNWGKGTSRVQKALGLTEEEIVVKASPYIQARCGTVGGAVTYFLTEA